MWGRAGRRSEGLALYIAGEDALDQFFCRHPEEFLERPVEAAILDHENERIQLAHLLAAAYEVPLSDADAEVFGERWRERADALVGLGELRRGREGRYLPRGPRFPAGDISLRSASPDSVAIVERGSGELLGAVEAERAFTTVHPGAVYLHLGRSYEVRELDIEGRRAVVDRFDGDWYTQPRKETEVFIERIVAKSDDPVARDRARALELFFGEVSVTEQVMAFQRKRLSDHQVIDMVALDLPETNFPTQALWYVLGDELAGPGGASARGPAGRAPRRRARPDRGAAAARDVRPLGHRRPVDQRPLPDRPADDLHLRRLSGRGGDRAARLRAVRAPGRRRREADRRVPLRRRLPIVRPEPQVRQPQRAAAQAGRAGADDRDAEPGRLRRPGTADGGS